MVRKTVEHATAAEQRRLREIEERLTPEIFRATLAVIPFARVIADAQRAAEACPESGTRSGRLAHLIRNCPDGVNPFAAPDFFSTLFRLWEDLKLDAYGRDPQPSFVANFSGGKKVRFSSASSRRDFDEILAAIEQTVSKAKKGRPPVGFSELAQRAYGARLQQRLLRALRDAESSKDLAERGMPPRWTEADLLAKKKQIGDFRRGRQGMSWEQAAVHVARTWADELIVKRDAELSGEGKSRIRFPA